MFHEAGQEIYNLIGLALANTVQHTKTANYHQGLEGGMEGRKKEEERRIHERQSELNLFHLARSSKIR